MPKWKFKFMVLAPMGVFTFNYKDTAYQFARATHGSLYPVSAIADYDPAVLHRDPAALQRDPPANRRSRVQIKAGCEPISVD